MIPILFLVVGTIHGLYIDTKTGLLSEYTTPPERSSSCFSLESRSLSTKPCIFPFKYEGLVHKGCITKNDPQGQLWCSTKVDAKGLHIIGGEYWGHCNSGCPVDLTGLPITTLEAFQLRGLHSTPFNTYGLTAAAQHIVENHMEAIYAPDVALTAPHVAWAAPEATSSLPDKIRSPTQLFSTYAAEIPEGRNVGSCRLMSGTVSRSDAFNSGNVSSVCGIRIERHEQDDAFIRQENLEEHLQAEPADWRY